MPSSTLSTVSTPRSSSPSSTSVMATAGCIPTTTVRASMMRAIAAMSESTRPMKESTISSSEMSMSTPRAPVRSSSERMRSCKWMTVWSSMST